MIFVDDRGRWARSELPPKRRLSGSNLFADEL